MRSKTAVPSASVKAEVSRASQAKDMLWVVQVSLEPTGQIHGGGRGALGYFGTNDHLASGLWKKESLFDQVLFLLIIILTSCVTGQTGPGGEEGPRAFWDKRPFG